MRCRVRAEDLYWRLACRQASWLPGPLCRLSGTMALRAALGDPHRFAQGLAWRLPDADWLTTQRMLAAPMPSSSWSPTCGRATGRGPR